MKKLLLLLTLAAVSGYAQTNMWLAVQTNAPRTYYDAFNATPDALLIKGFTIIGNLNDQVTYPVEVRAERLLNPQTTNSVYAVGLRTKVNQQTEVDNIDYDELDALIRSVTSISQANSSVTPLENFEVVFRTRGGLSVAKVGKGNKTTIAITSGELNGARNAMAPFVLDDFGRLLVMAKAKIDMVVASGQ
jgi:hypothetical protein